MTLDVPPNPLVMVTLQFEDGARLTWKLTRPIEQFDVFAEIGKLGAKYNLGIDFDIPAPSVETPDAAGGGTNGS